MLPRDPDLRCSNVVCDIDHSDMRFGQVRLGGGIFTSVLEGWKCISGGCKRFYGMKRSGEAGYGDIDDQEDLVNLRASPTCAENHREVPTYIQRTKDGTLQWVCPLCDLNSPFIAG